MAAILALPPPSSLPATTTSGRAKALLKSDALPVTPIQQVPDEERRQQLRQAAEQSQKAVDDGAASVKNGASRRTAGEFAQGKSDSGATTENKPRVDLQTRNAGPSSAFVAQSLYQESIGTGLHIEPWNAAISAYQRADSVGLQSSRNSLSL